jgi:hypothetical protein
MHTTGIIHHFNHSNVYTNTSYIYSYIWRVPLAMNSPCQSPFLLTWHPPDVIGVVHLSPRLLVN